MAISPEAGLKIRRTMIRMAKRGQRPGSGSSIEFLKRRTADVEWFDLSDILAGIDWAVIGAVATRHYMPERATKDLDVAIAAKNAKKVRQLLEKAGFTYKSELGIAGSHWITPNGQELDVIEVSEKWWTHALKAAQNNRDLQGLPVLPLPQLVFSKMRTMRPQDVADATRVLGQATLEQLDETREFLKKYGTPEEVEDLESLVQMGQLELEDKSTS
jgi:hypothetical protein